MMTHELKTVQPYFDAVADGSKTFEIRKNDRGFKVGDRLRLREYNPAGDSYSGTSVYADITYITDYAQQPGYVVMGIRKRYLKED